MKYAISFLLLSYYGFVSTVFAQSLEDALKLTPKDTASGTETPTASTTSPKGNAETRVSSFLNDEIVSPSKNTGCDSIPKNAVLKKGVEDSNNKNVRKLQTYLVKAGYLKAAPNGYFGLGTHNAVRAFQKKYSFMVTGIVGPYTLAKINELSCMVPGSAESTRIETPSAITKKVLVSTTTLGVVASKQNESTGTPDGPVISLFSLNTSSSGVNTYSAKIKNVDAVSVKAMCPTSIVEVKQSVGLTKVKIPLVESVCSKEKYLYLSDSNIAGNFERSGSSIVYIDRDGISSWFAIDASTTPAVTMVQYKVKACLASTCVEKMVSGQVGDYFQKVMATDLSLEDVRVDTSQKLYLTARNFNHITIKAGCPYNTQAIDSNGTVLTDGTTPCNVEKDIVAKQTTDTASYDKPEGVALKNFGFNFEIKPVNGQTDMYSNIELTVKACTGTQADTVSSTTLRCAEKKTYLPVYKK